MAQRDPGEVPPLPLADLLGGLGILVALGGAVLVAVRLAMLAWYFWAWWSGFLFIGAGVGLFLLSAVGAWVYTSGIPALRARWHAIKYEVRQRREQRLEQQAQQQAEGEGDG